MVRLFSVRHEPSTRNLDEKKPAVHWLQQTPRMGSLAGRMQQQGKAATATAYLSYDTRSWLTTFKLLDIRSESRFVLMPWLAFTGLSIALALVLHFDKEFALTHLADVPSVAATGVGSILSLLARQS